MDGTWSQRTNKTYGCTRYGMIMMLQLSDHSTLCVYAPLHLSWDHVCGSCNLIALRTFASEIDICTPHQIKEYSKSPKEIPNK